MKQVEEQVFDGVVFGLLYVFICLVISHFLNGLFIGLGLPKYLTLIPLIFIVVYLRKFAIWLAKQE